ncbi:MAG: hypothetical protein ACP5PQ_07145 [Thermoproteota archaeon]
MTCDDFPFDLYYLKLYDRMKQVRAVVRRCLADYTRDDEYRQALLEIEGILTEIVEDVEVKGLVRRLREAYWDFQRLRRTLERGGSRKKVEARVRECVEIFEKKGESDARYRKVVEQIKSAWEGLFYCYDDERIPRTNNDLEGLIRRLRSLWRRITACNVMDEWILFHAPDAIYVFNFLDGYLEELGLGVTLGEALASVKRETYTAILRKREERKFGDRFRRRVNRNPKKALKEIVEENQKLRMGA